MKLGLKGLYDEFPLILVSYGAPLLIVQHPHFVILSIFGLYLYRYFINKGGHSIILLATVLMLPTVPAEISGISPIISLLNNAIRLMVLIPFIWDFILNKNKRIVSLHLPFIAAYLLLNAVYLEFSTLHLLSSLTLSLCYYFAFFVFVFDSGFKENYFIRLIIVFSSVIVFALVEYFANYSPYEIYKIQLEEVLVLRSSGLFVNPLIYTGCLLFFEVILLIIHSIYKRVNLLLSLLILIATVFSLSRTMYVAVPLIYIAYVFFTTDVSKFLMDWGKKLTIGTLLIVGAYVTVITYYPNVLSDIFFRFETNTDHRQGGYATCLKLLSNHPFGCGAKTFKVIAMEGIADYNFSVGFDTFDNFFLTQLSFYGIFSVIAFGYYFYFFVIFKELKSKKAYAYLSLIYFAFCLIGFSFDLQTYIQILVLISYTCAFVFLSGKTGDIERSVKYEK